MVLFCEWRHRALDRQQNFCAPFSTMASTTLHVSRFRVPSCCARASKEPAERPVSSCLIGTTFSRIRIPFASPSGIALSRGPYLKGDKMLQNVTDIEEIRPSRPYPATPSSYAGLPSWGLPPRGSRQASPFRLQVIAGYPARPPLADDGAAARPASPWTPPPRKPSSGS